MMKHAAIHEQKVFHHVLQLAEIDLADFIAKSVRERSLSTIVADLNNDILFGTPAEREGAERALDRLGFVSA